ncbi:MAG: hypothetical protein AAF587_17595 [Bacteroidota bacterium]
MSSTISHFFLLVSLTGILLFGCGKELEERNAQLVSEVDSLHVELRQLRQENARLLELSGDQIQVGFEIQIGAFEYFDLQAYTDELVRFREMNDQGMNKYVLGRFRTFSDAEAFLKDVQTIGVKDAFIAGIVDGKRTTVAAAKAAVKEYYGNF